MTNQAIKNCLTNNTNSFSIWRTYYNSKVPILGGTHNVHDRIVGDFKKGTNISKFTQDDANLLTLFFRQYRNQIDGKSGSLSEMMTVELLNETVQVPWIDFQQGGAKFEKYLETLIDKSWEDGVKTAGSELGSVRLNLGQGELTQDFVEKILGESFGDVITNFEKALENEILTQGNDGNIYLKIKTSRQGKIDNMGRGSEFVNIIGEPTGDLNKIINILGSATFSVKSYKTDNDIHLGQTVGAKAIAAVSEFTGTQWARGSALFYLSHPKLNYSILKSSESETELEDIYNHYSHMKKIYELTGMGISYQDLGELTHVDFLLINRAHKGGDIQIYSTNYLIQTFLETGRFKYDAQIFKGFLT